MQPFSWLVLPLRISPTSLGVHLHRIRTESATHSTIVAGTHSGRFLQAPSSHVSLLSRSQPLLSQKQIRKKRKRNHWATTSLLKMLRERQRLRIKKTKKKESSLSRFQPSSSSSSWYLLPCTLVCSSQIGEI